MNMLFLLTNVAFKQHLTLDLNALVVLNEAEQLYMTRGQNAEGHSIVVLIREDNVFVVTMQEWDVLARSASKLLGK